MRVFYSLLLYSATPAVLLYFGWRGFRDSRWLNGWGQRFGLNGPVSAGGGVVVHAASVGEINAAAPLVHALLNRPNTGPVTISSFTPTGAARARELFGDAPAYVFAPLDLPGSTRRFLERSRPRLLIVMETEIWPNLYRQAEILGIPVVLANARLSERSVRGYRRFPKLVRGTLERLRLALAQTGQDGRRLVDCGLPADNLRVTGNLKYDIEPPAGLLENGARIRDQWGVERPVIIAASTHAEDDPIMLKAFAEARKELPSALLLLVPRHPERFDAATAAAREAGFATERLSDNGACSAATEVFIVDAMGRLMEFYAASDLAIIGGSFGETGGHNPLEPAALGVPVITGPNMSNFREVAASLDKAGALVSVTREGDLARTLIQLMRDRGRLDQMGAAAKELVASGRGALQGTLDEIEPLLV